jgi:uncharacterized membrane-anchored protein
MPLSPVTGEIVPAEWKVPFDILPADQGDTPEAVQTAEAVPAITAKSAERDAAKEPARALPFDRPPDDPGIEGPERIDG